MTDDRIWAVVVQQAMQQRRTTPTRSEMTTTEAGKRLLSFLDDPENAQSPLEPQWVDAIEAEAYAMGHNDGKVPWPSRDAARAAAIAAERARIREEIKTLPTFELPTGTYVDIEAVFDAIEGTDA